MKKLLIIFLVLALVVILGATSIKAANTFTTTLSANKTTVNKGEEVTITVGINNIDVGEYGINAIEAVLNYDTDVIEEITANDIGQTDSISSSWDNDPRFNAGKFVLAGSPVTSQTNILNIKLKIRDDATARSTTISLTDILASNGIDAITSDNASITLSIGDNTGDNDGNNTGNDNTANENEVTNDVENNNGNNVNNNGNNNSNNNFQLTTCFQSTDMSHPLQQEFLLTEDLRIFCVFP